MERSKLKKNVLNMLRDSYTIPWNCPKFTPWQMVWRTLCYRLASLGISISENERRLAQYKDRHKNQRAFILGNGPSLNHCELGVLKSEITFGVNSIFLNYEKMGFHPTYYVVEDVFVAEDRAEEINRYQGPKKFFGNYLKYCIKGDDNTIWLNVRFRYDNYPGFPRFSKNALRMLWTGGTVTYLCMQLAYFMGFSELYLIGFDHAYSIPEDVVIEGNQITSLSDDPNHFDPTYFGQGYRWHDPNVERMEKAYRKANIFFSSDNRKIFNATKGGRLEIFKRIEFESLFK
jgi:hypothetical protein